MSVRRQTANRLTLFRTCGTCGKQIVTTADTPWVRQVERDGKRQATTYFCSEGCFAASYKHGGWCDGKARSNTATSASMCASWTTQFSAACPGSCCTP